ncbi:MAG: hypothetical protein HY665_00530 [Chloroflexi bacterium]|nr:hypothetical protein [Chloroflexota bacterium]
MRLGRTSWIVLSTGIALIAFFSIGAARSQKLQERDQLRQELSLVEQRLSKIQLTELTARQESLTKQLDEALAQAKGGKEILSTTMESIASNDILLRAADKNGIKILQINSPGLTTEKIEGVTYSVLPLTINAQGALPSLITFVTELNTAFKTGLVKSVDIRMPATGPQGQERPTASISMAIYSYQGN